MFKDHGFRAFCGVSALFLLGVYAGFLPLLFAAFVSFGCVRALSRRLILMGNRSESSNILAVTLVATVVVVLLTLAGFGMGKFLTNHSGLSAMGGEIAEVLDSAGNLVPPWLAEAIPEKDALLRDAGQWVRENAKAIGSAGITTLKTIGYALLGLLIGAMVAVRAVVVSEKPGPVTMVIAWQFWRLYESFWSVVSAQVKISALNTTLTTIYILVILPQLGIKLPFATTLIFVTFTAGLIPVAGNLISNTAIVLMSLTVGAGVAVASLAYLVVIHKLEYFINARFVGEKINARAFEIIIILVVAERLFGVAGVVAGPVFYAWAKAEWLRADKSA